MSLRHNVREGVEGLYFSGSSGTDTQITLRKLIAHKGWQETSDDSPHSLVQTNEGGGEPTETSEAR